MAAARAIRLLAVILEIQRGLADHVRAAARDAFDFELPEVSFQYPPRVELGDLALTAPFWRERLEGAGFDVGCVVFVRHPAEVAAAEALPHWAAAVALRRADDGAKVPGADVPPLEHWTPIIRTVAGTRH